MADDPAKAIVSGLPEWSVHGGFDDPCPEIEAMFGGEDVANGQTLTARLANEAVARTTGPEGSSVLA